MARLFVAARPDRATSDALRALPRPDEDGVRWVPEENWHVTLRFLGDVDPSPVVDRLRRVALPIAVARLGPSVTRLGGQIVVPVAGVDALASAVRTATATLVEPDHRRFVGHLTIARTRAANASSILGTPLDARFTIREIAVMASDLRPTGAVYTTLATLPLTDDH